MRSEVASEEFCHCVRSGAVDVIDALERATIDHDVNDLTDVLVTAAALRNRIDALIVEITEAAGAFGEETSEERRQRRPSLDVVKAPNGGYILDGYLLPEDGVALLRALDAVIERQDAARRTAEGRQPSAGWPFAIGVAVPVQADGPLIADVGRNEPCPCGSGRKYKRCCGPSARALASRNRPRGPPADAAMLTVRRPAPA